MTEKEESLAAVTPAALQPHRNSIEAWLLTLSERKRAAILNYTASEKSVVLSYLYATFLGHQGSVDDWEGWVLHRWRKLDHRAVLETEIMALTEDIAGIRNAVEEGKIRIGDAPTKLAYLSKELRGHIETLGKDITTHDRRSLLLAGVSLLEKMLRKVYGRDGSVWGAIEACIEAAAADIDARHGAG